MVLNKFYEKLEWNSDNKIFKSVYITYQFHPNPDSKPIAYENVQENRVVPAFCKRNNRTLC